MPSTRTLGARTRGGSGDTGAARAGRLGPVAAALLALGTLGATLGQAEEPRAAGAGEARSRREEALIELGRRLFFDPKASRTASRACAACHDPLHGFSDPLALSDDELGSTRRHSQTLLDTFRNPSAHWDGEFTSVEQLVLARVGALPGGSHGLSGPVTSSSERRERSRQARHAATSPEGQAPAASAPAATPAPAAAPATAAPAEGQPEEGESAGDAQPKQDPEAAKPAAEPEQAFVPAPKDNPSYVGRFGQPQGTVGLHIRKPKDGEPKDPGAGSPQEPSDPKPSDASDDGEDGGGAAAEPPATTPPGGLGAPAPAAKPTAGQAEEQRRKRAEEEAAARADVASLPRVAQVLEREGRYREAFEAAFGSQAVSDVRIAQAVGAYVRSIRSTPSAFDRFQAGDTTALSAQALQGLALFRGRAGCATCHPLEGANAPVSDFAFHNTGIEWQSAPAGTLLASDGVDAALDGGRQGVSSRPTERRAFKTPTLRDVAQRGPYMHDGSLATLGDVVRYYAGGGSKDPQQDARLQGFEATSQEVAALVAFLQSLSGSVRPGQAERVWSQRAEQTVLGFVDALGRPLSGLEVRLMAVGDALPGARPTEALALRTDDAGRVTYTPRAGTTHMQVVLPADMGTLAQEWVPDSCRQATVRVPVRGRVRVVLTADDARVLPEQLALDLPGARALPNQVPPRVTLTRVGAVTGEGGVKTALYAAWVRDDLPKLGQLRVPGDRRQRAPILLRLDADATLGVDLR